MVETVVGIHLDRRLERLEGGLEVTGQGLRHTQCVLSRSGLRIELDGSLEQPSRFVEFPGIFQTSTELQDGVQILRSIRDEPLPFRDSVLEPALPADEANQLNPGRFVFGLDFEITADNIFGPWNIL